jgi:Flp pilus assembly protein protease CpaA
MTPRRSLHMRVRLLVLLSAGLLVVAALMLFRGELQAHNPRHLNRIAAPATECGFWGDMSAGMSCR